MNNSAKLADGPEANKAGPLPVTSEKKTEPNKEMPAASGAKGRGGARAERAEERHQQSE